MHELLSDLPASAFVLDLGCGRGSFDAAGKPFTVVRTDREREDAPGLFVQSDAAQLPFASAQFDVVISNHSLEHFEDLAGALKEIGRVVQSTGALYVGVPDSSTFADRLYRWLARGGGHVNSFTSADELASRIERATGLRHIGTRKLCTSLCFLNRNNRRTAAPRKLLLLGGGSVFSLRVWSCQSRVSDRLLGTRLCVYGWALYFGTVKGVVEERAWTNICIRCGSGFSSDWLLHDRKIVERHWMFLVYRCPQCGTVNPFTKDWHL